MVEKNPEGGFDEAQALSKQQSLLNDAEIQNQEDELKKMQQELEESKQSENRDGVSNGMCATVKEGEEGELVESGEATSQAGATEAAKDDPDEKSVFVKNVDFGADEDSIREHFKMCGEVERITIRKNHHTQQPLG